MRRTHERPDGRRAHPTQGGAYHWHEYGIGDLLPQLPTGSRVLLLGCGDAGERPYLRELGLETFGLDVRRTPVVDVLGDGHALPFSDGAFDLVLSMQVLEHFRAPWIAAREIARVMRAGGWFVGSVAFMKPYHKSYFHMSHQGVRELLQSVGLETDRFAAAQSVTYSIYGTLFPIGSRRIRRALFGAVDRLLTALRVKAWSWTRREDPDRPIDRFHEGFPISFRNLDRLRRAPSVVFRARKAESEPDVRSGRSAEREAATEVQPG